MNRKKQLLIILLITVTLISTIGVQMYWNYKNFQINKQRIINETQQSLDEAIEEYYAIKTKKEYLTIVSNNSLKNLSQYFVDSKKVDSLVKGNSGKKMEGKSNSKTTQYISVNKSAKSNLANNKTTGGISVFTSNSGSDNTILMKEIDNRNIQSIRINKKAKSKNRSKSNEVQFFTGKAAADSIQLIEKINSIIISISVETIDYCRLDSLIDSQLQIREIALDYTLQHFKQDTLFYQSDSNHNEDNIIINKGSSSYLKKDESLKIIYFNPFYQAFKRSLIGILLSLLLSIIIIFSLFYLLYIIRKQKQLSEIKNDLISNITHEFKTPITTANAAIEAIQEFDVLRDKEKTQQYLSISKQNLTKLYTIVNKLLDTATLNSKNLQLNKEPLDLVPFFQKMVTKMRVNTDKKVELSRSNYEITAFVDEFHFENAINNIVDNAIKYGGNEIDIQLNQIESGVEIVITDNGGNILPKHKERVFDKFYRIPTGNTHNVKGFGIGLFYTRQIIEKHGGKITLVVGKNLTSFKITLPNE